ncbi:MAG TPA: hypothetical protein PLQ34_07725 [Ferrovaceae bacterium]|jgi:hypothetical protein|nr:hypothetical protein [Ferrovaceae bacterium]
MLYDFGTVTIARKKYEIKRRDNALANGEVGHVDYGKRRIVIGESVCFKLEEVLLHEMVHAVLHSIGEHDLNANEKFVTKFSSVLHKAIKSLELKQHED